MPLKDPLTEQQKQELATMLAEIYDGLSADYWANAKDGDEQAIQCGQVLDDVLKRFAGDLEIWLK